MSLPLIDYGRATAEDYWGLPDGQRAELIDGELYGMTPPNRMHQKLVARLSYALQRHIEQQGGDCEVYPAPFAVNLTGDDATWVEPDVSVICDPRKLSDRGCEGAPDFVIEVVSPSSRHMDYQIKANLYGKAGVREYWIVDPARQRTGVYRFGPKNPIPLIAPFSLPVDVATLPGLSITIDDLLA